jgi:hypothetical protein
MSLQVLAQLFGEGVLKLCHDGVDVWKCSPGVCLASSLPVHRGLVKVGDDLLLVIDAVFAGFWEGAVHVIVGVDHLLLYEPSGSSWKVIDALICESYVRLSLLEVLET